jgi:MFS family permease
MIYLAAEGLSEGQIGLLFTLKLIGDTVVSLWASTAADHLGRRRMLIFGANVLAGVSPLTAARSADRIGLVRTMIFTHIPSNILLILVPLMPNLRLAIAMLLLRFSISQMDVPTRQSYTMAIVRLDERAAAAGITGIARTTGASLSPIMAGALLPQASLLNVPFFLAGGLKIIYDLLLYKSFRCLRPPEETGDAGVTPGSR